MSAPQVDLVLARFTQAVSLAEQQITECMVLIVEEIVTMTKNLEEHVKEDGLKKVIASRFEESDSIGLEELRGLFKSHGTSQEGQKVHIMFNKFRAGDADAVSVQSNAQAMRPNIFVKLNDCKENMGNFNVQNAQRAIANLTALTSLFHGLQAGETRNVLVNKVLKGFLGMKLKPFKDYCQAFSQHATPDIYQQFLKSY